MRILQVCLENNESVIKTVKEFIMKNNAHADSPHYIHIFNDWIKNGHSEDLKINVSGDAEAGRLQEKFNEHNIEFYFVIRKSCNER